MSNNSNSVPLAVGLGNFLLTKFKKRLDKVPIQDVANALLVTRGSIERIVRYTYSEDLTTQVDVITLTSEPEEFKFKVDIEKNKRTPKEGGKRRRTEG